MANKITRPLATVSAFQPSKLESISAQASADPVSCDAPRRVSQAFAVANSDFRATSYYKRFPALYGLRTRLAIGAGF
jgi:hypothetical protein